MSLAEIKPPSCDNFFIIFSNLKEIKNLNGAVGFRPLRGGKFCGEGRKLLKIFFASSEIMCIFAVRLRITHSAQPTNTTTFRLDKTLFRFGQFVEKLSRDGKCCQHVFVEICAGEYCGSGGAGDAV